MEFTSRFWTTWPVGAGGKAIRGSPGRPRSGSLAPPIQIGKKIVAERPAICGLDPMRLKFQRATAKELRIGDLNRDAGFAQRNVLQFPSGVGFAFGVGIGGVAVAEFDGVGRVKIARLHA